jgi:hypothetical protein
LLLAPAALAIVSIANPRNAAAQAPVIPPLAVSIRVTDSIGTPVEGADVAVLQGINDSRASGTTDARGRVSLSVTEPRGDYQLVVRKIGYLRADQFFRAAPRPLSFEISMHRNVQALTPVQINERQDLKRKSYFIDADEIAKHADELIDATDILKKLKPDMICGRSCRPLAAVAANAQTPARRCPSLAMQPRRACPRDNTPPSLSTNVWVNGVWIRGIATDAVCQTGRRGMLAGLAPGTMQVLCEILPEHIEQIKYADEWDTSVGKNHSDSALFIVLKAGIAYEPGRMSYVVDQGSTRRKPSDTTTTQRDSMATLPPYRYRLLGVFDQDSGDPIDSARVIDANSGTYTTTTATGTVSLVFLPEGSSLVHITRPGYEDLTITVDIGPNSTAGLTLLMKKRPPRP